MIGHRALAVLACCWLLLVAACGDNLKPATRSDAGSPDAPGAPTLVSISVSPAAPQLPVQMQQQLTATGQLSDGTTEDVTATATWTSADATIATVDAGGKVTAVGPGTVAIEATVGAISGTATVTITSASLVSIAVTPHDPAALALGLTQQLTATGTFSDSSTLDVTAQATWTATTPAIATVAAGGLVSTVAIGSTPVTATLNSISGSTTITVAAAALVSIAITPANPAVSIGATQQLTATGTYTDGSTMDLTATAAWTSSDPTLATVDAAGLATAVAAGAPTITATQSGISGTTTLTIAAAALVSIAVAPGSASIDAGSDQPFAATGTYTDLSTKDITATVTWSTSDPTIATITAAGDATGVGAGSATITATQGAISGTATLAVVASPLVSIAITPANPSIAAGTTQQLTATGTYADSSTRDLTAQVTWSTSDPTIATITTAGLATGVAEGPSTITATLGAISGATTLTVSAAALVSIAITPPDSNIAIGLSEQLVATGTFSNSTTQDLTLQVAWTSSDPTIATITSVGLATGVANGGPTTITATLDGISGTTTLTVGGPVLMSIAVTPANPSIVPAGTQQFVATGTYSDTSTQILTTTATWASTATATATIAATGKATGVAPGTTTITATSGAVVGSTQLTVEGLELGQIAPVDGTVGVRTSPAIVLAFNIAVDPTTITPIAASGACTGSVQLSADGFVTCIGLAATYNAADTVVTLATASSLVAGTTYKVRVLGTVATTAGFALGADVTQPNGFTVGGGSLVISQLYGAGGNTGAFFNQDFVELHNNAATPVNLAGYSIQYASAAGTSWTVGALPSVVVPAGGYYLVGLATGATGAALPAAIDATITSINLSATTGKVALVPGTGSLSAQSCPLASTLDFIGYGTANCFEGTAVAPAPSATASDLRGDAGCTDTNVNSADFTVNAFATGTLPRDSATAADVCM